MENEKRLIEANAVLGQIADEMKSYPGRNYDDYIDGKYVGLEKAIRFIKNAPSVEAVEVVHGHWYKAPHHPYRCSNCGETALLDMYGESHYRSNYCPNCGAKMDGDGNG